MCQACAAYGRGYSVNEDGDVFGPRGQRKLHLRKDGYLMFTFKDEAGAHQHVSAHRLAAFQWFGDELHADGLEVRHLNGKPADNRRSNLALGTKTQNMFDRDPQVRRDHAEKAARTLRKLSDEQVVALRKDRENGADYKTLMVKYGIAKGTVSYICNGVTYAKI